MHSCSEWSAKSSGPELAQYQLVTARPCPRASIVLRSHVADIRPPAGARGSIAFTSRMQGRVKGGRRHNEGATSLRLEPASGPRGRHRDGAVMAACPICPRLPPRRSRRSAGGWSRIRWTTTCSTSPRASRIASCSRSSRSRSSSPRLRRMSPAGSDSATRPHRSSRVARQPAAGHRRTAGAAARGRPGSARPGLLTIGALGRCGRRPAASVRCRNRSMPPTTCRRRGTSSPRPVSRSA